RGDVIPRRRGNGEGKGSLVLDHEVGEGARRGDDRIPELLETGCELRPLPMRPQPPWGEELVAAGEHFLPGCGVPPEDRGDPPFAHLRGAHRDGGAHEVRLRGVVRPELVTPEEGVRDVVENVDVPAGGALLDGVPKRPELRDREIGGGGDGDETPGGMDDTLEEIREQVAGFAGAIPRFPRSPGVGRVEDRKLEFRKRSAAEEIAPGRAALEGSD